jgi:hypothetical protein
MDHRPLDLLQLMVVLAEPLNGLCSGDFPDTVRQDGCSRLPTVSSRGKSAVPCGLAGLESGRAKEFVKLM